MRSAIGSRTAREPVPLRYVLAVQRYSTAIYPDDEMLKTLQALTQDADHDIRQAATTTLDHVQEVRSLR